MITLPERPTRRPSRERPCERECRHRARTRCRSPCRRRRDFRAPPRSVRRRPYSRRSIGRPARRCWRRGGRSRRRRAVGRHRVRPRPSSCQLPGAPVGRWPSRWRRGGVGRTRLGWRSETTERQSGECEQRAHCYARRRLETAARARSPATEPAAAVAKPISAAVIPNRARSVG